MKIEVEDLMGRIEEQDYCFGHCDDDDEFAVVDWVAENLGMEEEEKEEKGQCK